LKWDDLIEQVAAGQPCSAAGYNKGISGAMVSELLKAARGDGDRPVLRETDFTGVVFEDSVDFTKTLFENGARFKDVNFKGNCRFSLAEFKVDADFRGATFSGEAIFENLKPGRYLDFTSANFSSYSHWGPLEARKVDFSLAHFLGSAVFRDLKIENFLNFVGACFNKPVWHFNVGCRHLSLNRARFECGATLRLHGGQVVLDGAEFMAPSFILGSQKIGSFLNQDGSLVVDSSKDEALGSGLHC
jgi:uncharacterized protein YjbI with pentapeptide repeats